MNYPSGPGVRGAGPLLVASQAPHLFCCSAAPTVRLVTDNESPATAAGGTGTLTNPGDESVHAANARMRQEWLQAALDYSTSESETERDAAKLRMEEICTGFLVKNRKLAMSGAKDFLAHAGSLTSDYEQVAMMALWEAFAGTDPTLMHQVSWRPNPADTASAELLARVAEADNSSTDEESQDADVVAYRESVKAYQDAIDRGLYLVGATGWDPAKSTFGGYSRVFIRGAVQRAVANNESGLSYALWSHRPKVEAARKQWIDRHGSEPSVAELARVTGLKADTVRAIRTPAPVSADTPIGENFTIADTLADKESEELGDDRDLISDVVAAAAADGDIKPMDLMSLVLRRGLLGLEPLTVVDAGARLGLGRGTVQAGSDNAWKKVVERVQRVRETADA